VLDIDRGALLKDGADVPLRPKCFKVLSYLVEHHGLLVTKDEVLGAVWPDIVVTEDSLTQCLIQIRKVLGDTSRDMIRTVPRRGYLFDVPVTVHTPGKSPVAPGALDSFMSGRRPSRWSVGAAIVLALAIAVNWWNARIQHVEDRMPTYVQASILPGSVAVLPFVDMSPKGDLEYFGDGISEEVLNLLAQTPELTVISRTSSFSFKDQNADIEAISQKLNVASVLEGSVRKNGDQVRITAQLVKASNSAHLWSQTYDRSLDDVFAVQREIAGSVAAVLKVKLLGDGYTPVSVSVSDTPNAKAHEHYLQGKLADAWVGLASSMIIHAFRNGIPWEESVARRKEALDKAIELDPNHAEAHIRLAQHYRRLSEMDTARQHYDEALRYGQNSALVLSMAAGAAFHEANFEQAIELQMRAVALDPLGFANRENLAGFLFHAGRFDEAGVEFLNALDLNPAMSDYINDNLVQILVLQQQCEEAGVLIQQLPEGIAKDQGLAIVHHVRGQEAEANAAIARLTADPGVEPAARLAEIYAFRGNLDESFKWLDSARDRIYKTGRNSWDWQDLRLLFTSPFLRPLHDDPRWEMWLAEMETRTS